MSPSHHKVRRLSHSSRKKTKTAVILEANFHTERRCEESFKSYRWKNEASITWINSLIIWLQQYARSDWLLRGQDFLAMTVPSIMKLFLARLLFKFWVKATSACAKTTKDMDKVIIFDCFVLIGSLDYLCPLWLARVITLVLVLRHSIETALTYM